jgi:ATP-dependent Clp protease ATP-binding subunit ClpC
VDEWSVSRLIGDYYNPEGQLTGKIRYNPFGVILLDEIEKAHPKIHDLLLQVLDDARLTDALGRVVDFSNTIIIMTSNIGASQAATRLGFETSQANQEAIYRKAVENFFRPEFINRIDQIVIFQSLLLEHIFDIAKLQIRSLLSRDGFVRRTTILNIEPSALEWVAQRGYDGKMGGRALKRQIERDLTSFTAEQLIQSKNEVPIIFSINLEDGKLNPVVEPLDFINPLPEDWLPEIPQEQQLRKAFSALLEQAQDLHADLVDWEDLRAQNQAQPLQAQDFQENWQYYDFKNRLADLKEHLQRLIISFHSDYFYKLSENALRMKTASNSIIVKRGDARRNPERTLLKDKLFQKSALDELRYVYQHAPEQFSKQQSVYLESLLELHFLELAFNDLQEDKRPDHYWLEISSSISGQGKEEVKFLQDSYLRLFQGIGLGCQARENGLLIEGYGAWSLLEGEVGYHLFYRSHQNPLPIRVQAQNLHDAKDLRQASAKVIRLYDIWLGVEHKGSTITDLRTGLTNHAQITVGEFKLFLYAGSLNG